MYAEQQQQWEEEESEFPFLLLIRQSVGRRRRRRRRVRLKLPGNNFDLSRPDKICLCSVYSDLKPGPTPADQFVGGGGFGDTLSL